MSLSAWRGGVVAAALALLLAGCSTAENDSSPRAAPGSPTASPTATASESFSEPPVTEATYVALGDSYTSAPGVPVTDTSSGCLRSDRNYPALVAEALDLPYVDVSCGGASTASLVGAQQTSTGPVPPQFDALEETTELVTIGMGGNDENLFSELVATCAQISQPSAAGAPCRDAMSAGGSDRLLQKIPVIRERVTSALLGIHDRAPDATVVLVGYPQLAPPSGTCPELPLAAGDYRYVRSITARLGGALAAAAKEGDALYIDMLAASRGNDICAGDKAWVNGASSDMERAIAFHPFAEEQEAVARLVVDAVEAP